MLYEHVSDGYGTAENSARANMYGVTGVPTMCFDGMNPKAVGAYTNDETQYNWYKGYVNTRLNVASPFEIEAVYFVGGDNGKHAYIFEKVINTSGVAQSNATMMFAAYEDLGSQMYHYTCRRVTSGGTYSFAVGETKYFGMDLNCALYSSPNMDNVGIVVFAQNTTLSLKDVHQAYLADRVDPEIEAPEAYTIIRGVLKSGGLGDLAASDDSRLVVQAGITLDTSEPPVWLTIDGTSTTATPLGLVFTLEAGANTSGLTQKIALYNYVTNQFEEIDSRNVTTSDSVAEVMITGDPSRFVNQATLAMKARLTWKASGPVLLWPFQVGIDQAVWKIVE
jgi:hypothetical protein